MSAVIRVLLLEDDHHGRRDLATPLSREEGIAVVGTVEVESDLAATLPPRPAGHRAAHLAPTVAVVNTGYMVSQILPLVSELTATEPACAVIILCDPGKRGMLPPRRRARQLSYLVQDTPVPALATAVRQVAAGARVTDPRLEVAVIGTDKSVSTREWEVLGLAARGEPVADIARRLYLSLGTVRNHISSVITKTGARNRLDAIRIGRKEGWLR